MQRVKVFFPHTDNSITLNQKIEEESQKLIDTFDKYINHLECYVSSEESQFKVKIVLKTVKNDVSFEDRDDSAEKAFNKSFKKVKNELKKLKKQYNHIHTKS